MYGFSGLQGGSNKTKVFLVVALVLVVVLAAALGVVFMQKKAGSAPQAPNAKSDNTAVSERIVKKVSDLYDVPTTEEPTVAAIQDRSKLDGQEFFNKAQNGDYLLVYTKSKLAILYREKTDKLINVGPVNMQDPDKKGSDTANQAANP